MSNKNNDKYFYLYFITASLITIAILILSLISTQKIPDVGFKFSDKIGHFIAYATLVFVWIWTFFKKNPINVIQNTTLFTIIASCIMYSILLEVLQYTINTGRNFEISDIFANIVGTLFGVFLFKLIKTSVYE